MWLVTISEISFGICSSEAAPQTDEGWSNNPQMDQMDAD